MYISTYPVVCAGPETTKLNSALVELKANSDIVELEFTVKMLDCASGVKAKLTVLLAALKVEVASTAALIK